MVGKALQDALQLQMQKSLTNERPSGMQGGEAGRGRGREGGRHRWAAAGGRTGCVAGG